MTEEHKKSKMSMLNVQKSQSKLHVGSKSVSMLKSQSRLKMRRQSYGFGGVPGIRPVERTSNLAIEFKRPPLLFLNTYQLEPLVPFHLANATAVVNKILDDNFTGHKYNPHSSPALTVRLAGEMMRAVKAMQFNRYRVLAIVTIGQRRSQSYNNAITFLWDHERDNYVNVQREENTAFLQATIFAVYFD